MTLGQMIKEHRIAHGYSMDDFAKQSGMSKAYVSILERNYNPTSKKPAVPSLETIKNAARAMRMETNDLIAALEGEATEKAQVEIPPGFIPIPKMIKVPLLGSIACGVPILAEQNIEGHVDVPEEKQVDFCLRCQGDSMIDAGIRDKDVVYIRKQPTVENGQIAAVRIGTEATLKRVYWDGRTLTLMPANSAYPPSSFTGEQVNEVSIEGKMVGYTHWA